MIASKSPTAVQLIKITNENISGNLLECFTTLADYIFDISGSADSLCQKSEVCEPYTNTFDPVSEFRSL